MMTNFKALVGTTATMAITLAATSLASAQRAEPEVSIEQAVQIARDNGVTLIDDIELDDGLWEIDGYTDDSELELDISAQSGEIVNRDESTALFRPDQPAVRVEQAIEIAQANGMTMITDAELDGRKWEFDGYAGDGREMELEISTSDGEVLKVEFD
jgi:uncharacterized membrane protein YkoI